MKGVMVVDVRAWRMYEDHIRKIENVKCLGLYSCEAFLVATSYFRTVASCQHIAYLITLNISLHAC